MPANRETASARRPLRAPVVAVAQRAEEHRGELLGGHLPRRAAARTARRAAVALRRRRARLGAVGVLAGAHGTATEAKKISNARSKAA